MSIEAMKLAAEFNRYFTSGNGVDVPAKVSVSRDEWRALFTAIQQAEAQQLAAGEPVVSRNPFAPRCYTMSESHLSGHRLIVGFEKLGDAQDAHEWVARQGRGDFTHPAPSAPGDVVRDAERYRWLRDERIGNCPESINLSHGRKPGLDAAIDAAMLAAKEKL